MLDSESPIVARATVEAPRPPEAPAPPPLVARPARRWRLGARPSWTDVALCLLGCGALLLWVESMVGLYMPDDAYITYRYAENLAAGAGLRFNAATAPVEGYSNLSWIVLLAGLSKLGFDLPIAAANLGRLLSLLNLVLLYALSYRVVRRRGAALLAPALLALTAPYALWARGGLETMWYTTLLLLSVWLGWLALSRRLWAFPLAALALFVLALTRHDGAIPMGVAGLIVLIWALRGAGASRGAAGGGRMSLGAALRRRDAWVGLGSFAALALIFLLYTWWRGQYFGQLVPAPFFSRLGGTLTNPGAVSQTLATYFTRGSHYSAYGDLLVPTLAAAIAGFLVYRRPGLRDWLIAGSAAGLSFLYFISESYNPGIRYMVPVLPLLYLYAQLPLLTLLEKAWRGAGRGWRGRAALAGAGLTVAIFLLVMVPRTENDAERAETAKLQSLVPLGQWLHNYAPPRAAVALQDIGVVAYYSGLRVIDNNPGALTNGDLIYRSGAQGFADLTLRPQPEFLVFTSGSYETPKFYQEFATLQQDPRFLTRYALYGKVKYWPDRCYWLYKRSDVNLPDGARAAFPPSDW
jgi:arabinofuranosyltransferase